MKAGTCILYTLLVICSFSFKMTSKNTQLQDLSDLVVSVIEQANKNQQAYSTLDDYYSHLEEVDTIYFNGTILTMNGKEETAQAVSLKNGVIVQVGSNVHVFSQSRWSANNIKLINLNKKTMLPGFYDAHSHLAIHSLAKSTRLSLASPPIGYVTSIGQIKNIIRKYIEQKDIPQGEVIYCSFYNELALEEKRHITRLQLDEVSLNHVIVLDHISGHLAVANTKAIQMAGVTQHTPDPSGGKIERFINQPFKGTPSGVFKQRAKVQYLDKFSKKFKINEQSEAIIVQGMKDYIQSGITTAQEGFIGQEVIELLLQMKDRLKIDLRGYTPCFGKFSSVYEKYASQQTNKFKLQGIKLIIDGSIQGYTGYLSKPYYKQPQTEHYSDPNKHRNLQSNINQQELFRGSPIFQQNQINQMVLTALQRQVDVLAHCNGDAAIDIYIEAVRNAKQKYPASKSRITIIHAQTIRDDQLDQAKQLGMIPSFFVGHTYYWGDQHRDKFLGTQRAKRISPAGSALLRNIDFTLHNDSPVTPMQNGIMMTIWSAVNRLTLSGYVLGEQQKINVMQALKSVTINSAYQSHEQHIKGSIEKGKVGDLIILSENPLKVDPIKLKDILVLQTIKNGVTIFKRND